MYVLIPLGLSIEALAVLLLTRPAIGFEFGRTHFLTAKFQYGIGVFSLALAVSLYYAAADSKYPSLFEILAISTLFAGAIVLVLPQNIFRKLVSWELDTYAPYARVLGLVYALIGGFIIYAAI